MNLSSSPSLSGFFLLLVMSGLPRPASAYPGAPSTWGTWTQKGFLGIYPRQMDAASDPDGRLRLMLVDANRGRTFADGRFYYRPLVASFRWQDANSAVLEAVQAINGLSLDAPYELYRSDTVTPAAMNQPKRTQIAARERPGNVFAGRALFYRNSGLPADSAALGPPATDVETPPEFPYFPRKPWGGGRSASLANGRYGSAGAVDLGLNGAVAVDCQIGSFVAGAYFEMRVIPVSGQTGASMAGVPPLPWATDRIITGLDAALTPDNKDVYYALCSVKPTGSQASAEIRVYHHHQTSPSPPVYATGVSAWNTSVTRPGTADEVGWLYPKILLTKTGEPRWVLWSDPFVGLIKLAKRIAPLPDSDPSTDEDRGIGSYNVLPPINGEPSTIRYFSLGKGADAVMDALDRLHVVWHDLGGGDRVVHYARETASGSFEEITLPIRCSQPPTLAIGPGNYPYIAYAGPAAENGYLLITAPPGLLAAYHGDFEDRDRDGRPALIERAVGSSDNLAETGSDLSAFTLTHGLATISPGVRRFETSCQLNLNAVRTPSTTTWTLADGNDTIRIQPTYSIDGMKTFSPGGFTFVQEFTIPGRGRYVTVQDLSTVTNFPRQNYRLLVTRIPGAP